MTQISQYVRVFVGRHPGPFDASTPQQCLVEAYYSSGANRQMSLPEFTAALKLLGYEPKVVRDARGPHPMVYRLALPERGPGVNVRGFDVA